MACSGGFPGNSIPSTSFNMLLICHTGTYNDKTIARYDAFIKEVGCNPLFTDFPFSMFNEAGVEVEATGVHLICDGM
jgi:hypothetical protein